MTKPIVLIPCDVKHLGDYPFHAVGEKYIAAAAHTAGAMPLLLPAWGAGKDMTALTDHYDLDALFDRVHGVLLPGSYSNVHPRHYAGAEVPMEHDEQRDVTVFPLIPEIIQRNLPLFAICRGFQELNVAFGGTLNPQVHESGGSVEHRETTKSLEMIATNMPTRSALSVADCWQTSSSANPLASILCTARVSPVSVTS